MMFDDFQDWLYNQNPPNVESQPTNMESTDTRQESYMDCESSYDQVRFYLYHIG